LNEGSRDPQYRNADSSPDKPALAQMIPKSSVNGPVPRTSRQIISRAWSYLSALAIPVVIMLVGTRMGMPAFVFEHFIILLVVCIAILSGIGPAVVAAIAAALGDNILLRDPAGLPTITGVRDVLDGLLFVVVAVTVGWLVASARWQKARAEAAAARERQAREERDSLVAMVTHDLATPLGVIRGSIQFARQAGTTASADMDRLWVRLDRAAARATSLIRTLGDARTLDAGALALDLRSADLRSLIAAVVQMMDRVSERHPIALIMPNQPVLVEGDTERLERVFENLLSNAIKYSPDGGAVEIELLVRDGEAVLTVEDHGIGISPEALTRLFQRGYRADEARAIAPGLGLGLNISAEIIARHGGTLQARARTPSGSMFIVRLPIVSTAPVGEQAPDRMTISDRDSFVAR
jgi:signal transduction histidine kinase